jgi:hypothetical protein
MQSIDGKQRATAAEQMTKKIWSQEYKQKREKIIRRTKLKDERDDFK